MSSSSNESPPNHKSVSRYNKKNSGNTFRSVRSKSAGRSRSTGRPRSFFRRSDPPGRSKGHQRTNSNSNGRHVHKKDIRESDIIKGAEILRREISDDHDYEDWDPWRQPAPSFAAGNGPIIMSSPTAERRQEEISELTMPQYVEDTAAAVGANWVTASGDHHYFQGNGDDDGDDEDEDVFEDVATGDDHSCQVPQQQLHQHGDDLQHDSDEDSMNVIERAMSFLSSASKSFESPTTNQKQIYVEPEGTPPQRDYLVQRLSGSDNRSFQSMFGGSNYLPNNLQVDSNDKGLAESEEHETSTLDYIASLYTQDQDSKGRRSSRDLKEKQQRPAASAFNRNESRSDRQLRSPRITAAAEPFDRMVAPSSYFYDDLLKDPAYQHALKAGALWQSLCSQHVRFPALWWDGEEPACPPLGTIEKIPWSYLGRHRVQSDRKLNALIGNRGSSGRLLLHLVVRDDVTCEPIEDICCGVFHPNARGVRMTAAFDPKVEDCRDVWIGYRRRVQSQSRSTLESLLQRQNKNRAFPSPLGGPQSNESDVNNGNLKAVFGAKPPLFTVFVTESELFELIRNECKTRGSPVSVVLLRRYLRYRIG
ncbi:MAG: hypothetical protein SGILL_009775 [Bacillariaceae sp.]